ncbi:MAG: WD40/YVTN/BNR-like repeat-containing protein, partial [Actinomycetota bacterium]
MNRRSPVREAGTISPTAGRRRTATTLVALLAVLTGAVDVGSAASLVRVSQADPYASCSTEGETGRNYPSAEVEPQAAVNPRDPRNIVAVWQQDRWSNGGSRGIVAGVSFDGGASFTEVPLPFSRCVEGGADFPRASDPWVSFGPDGTAYAVALSVSYDTDTPATAIVAATSTDGGRSWHNLRVIQQDASPHLFNDKETVTADALTPGTAYVVWDRLEDPEEPFFTGPALFSKTIDGGRTWSDPKVIVQTGIAGQTVGSVIVTAKSGGSPLYNFFTLLVDSGPNKGLNVAFVKSTDGGETWSPPRIVTPLQSIAFTDHRTRLAGRTGDILISAAIDPDSGDLYV